MRPATAAGLPEKVARGRSGDARPTVGRMRPTVGAGQPRPADPSPLQWPLPLIFTCAAPMSHATNGSRGFVVVVGTKRSRF